MATAFAKVAQPFDALGLIGTQKRGQAFDRPIRAEQFVLPFLQLGADLHMAGFAGKDGQQHVIGQASREALVEHTSPIGQNFRLVGRQTHQTTTGEEAGARPTAQKTAGFFGREPFVAHAQIPMKGQATPTLGNGASGQFRLAQTAREGIDGGVNFAGKIILPVFELRAQKGGGLVPLLQYVTGAVAFKMETGAAGEAGEADEFFAIATRQLDAFRSFAKGRLPFGFFRPKGFARQAVVVDG